jgi:hypothetical protein
MIKSRTTFYAGLLFMAIGLLFLVGSTNYNMGTASSMGPGYFPIILSLFLIVLGIINVVRSCLSKIADKVGKLAFRPLVFVLLANIVFGIMLTWGGLVPAIISLTVIASFANKESQLREIILLGLSLALLSSIVFVGVLHMPIKLFTWGI